MDRRKFLSFAGAVPLVALPASSLSFDEPEIRYKDAKDEYWFEKIGGEPVEFGLHYDPMSSMFTVKAYWRSFETPRVSYALGHRFSQESFVESPYKDILYFAKQHKRTQTLYIAMGSTIAKVKGLAHVSDIYAPYKPEGSAIMLL